MYCAFKRLEEIGHIISYWGDENTGARRKYYRITKQGKEEYKNAKKEWQKTKEIIDKLI
jgi:DNA-binding PadR family transcriptional regulator